MTPPLTPAVTSADLMSAWDRQQELYIPAREARYELMADLVAQTAAFFFILTRVL